MTTVLIGTSAGLGALALLLLGLLVLRLRRESSAEERVAEVVASLNSRMDELGAELAAALERAEEESRRNRTFGELAGSIDLDEVLTRTLEAAGALQGIDAALIALANHDGKPLVATVGLSQEEAHSQAIAGPPDGRPSRSTSTTSRRSTTGSATSPATTPWPRRPSGCEPSSAPPTSPAAWAATNSRSCCLSRASRTPSSSSAGSSTRCPAARSPRPARCCSPPASQSCAAATTLRRSSSGPTRRSTGRKRPARAPSSPRRTCRDRSRLARLTGEGE